MLRKSQNKKEYLQIYLYYKEDTNNIMINETEDIDTLLSHKDKLNTSFESEKSTSLDYNKSHIKQSQEEFDSETDNFDNDESDIEIVSSGETEEKNTEVNPPSLLESISSTLTKLLEETSKKYHNLKKINLNSVFNCTLVPQISLYDYLSRIVKYTNIEKSTLIISLIYIDRICQRNFYINEHNIHKVLFASILVSIKYNEDDFYKNNYYSQIAGVSVKELFRMESDFLALIDFTLFVNDDLYEKYKTGLMHQFLL